MYYHLAFIYALFVALYSVIKRLLKISLLLILLLLVGIFGIGLYFKKNIQPILVSEINKTLAIPVHVDQIEVSGIRDFPNLGIKLTDVSIDESSRHYGQKLLRAKELNLFVDIWKLYQGEYVIDKVLLRDGTLRVADLKKGTNYNILKPTEDTNASAVSFEIRQLQLIDCDIQYEHIGSAFSSRTYSSKSTIELKLEDAITVLGISAGLDSTHIVSGGDQLVNGKNLKLNTRIHIDTKTETVRIDPSDLRVNDVDLKTQGTVTYGATSAVSIRFENANTKVASLISILPASIVSTLDAVALEGDVMINGTFSGDTYGKNQPAIQLDYSLDGASAAVKKTDLALTGISAKGSLHIPNIANMRTASATCTFLNAAQENNKIKGTISVNNFDKPHVKWSGIAILDAAFLIGLSDSKEVDITDGRLTVDGTLALTYDTRTQRLVPNSLHYAGKIKAEGIRGQLTNPDIKLNDLNLDISTNEAKMVVNNATFSYNKTTGSMQGYIKNYISLLNEESTAELVGKLTVTDLNVNELLRTSSQEKTETKDGSLLPIQLRLSADINGFRYNDFTAESLTGELLANGNSIRMPKCEITALEGTIVASLMVKKWGDNHLLDINSDLQNINITQLFKQFNNFEQNEITDKHLSGTLSGSIIAKVLLDKNYTPILPKLYAKTNVLIENGALIGYEPLKELSTFAKVEDLENVRFSSLQNTIEIFDQTIFIPKMKIENNALNLEIEGTHTFSNYMEYSIELSVAELLATKAKWIAKKAEKRIEKNKNGGLTAYILMEGTPDDLKIRYDRASATQNVKNEVTEEKGRLKKALKGETTLDEEEAKKKDYDDVWDE